MQFGAHRCPCEATPEARKLRADNLRRLMQHTLEGKT
jgi:hypothetical protein